MTHRIPAYDPVNPDGMAIWFAEMSARGLLFHPEDDPAEIVSIKDGARTFTDDEAGEVRRIIGSMFAEHGDCAISACYPVFMRACGQRLDA